LGSHFMTEWLLPSSPQRIPDQTMRKESVPSVFELSCAPTFPKIINHTGAHPCSKHSEVRTGLTCANQQQLSNVGSQHTVTIQSINFTPAL
jgi:predicted SPOUT superfamily RNA methylase MTH1